MKHFWFSARPRLSTFVGVVAAAVVLGVSGLVPSAMAAAATVPSVPLGVYPYQSVPDFADVVYQTPASDGGSPITGYLVTYTDLSHPFLSGTATTIPRKHDWGADLNPGDRYSFTVAAINAVGTGPASAATPALRVYTTPGAPTGLTVRPLNNAVYLSWTPPADDGYTSLFGYGIYWQDLTSGGGGDGGLQGSPLGVVFDIDMVNGHTYVFQLDASNAGGNSPLSAPSAPVTPGFPPGPPRNVAVTVTPDGTPIVDWTAPADSGTSPVTGYAVSYSNGGPSMIGTVKVGASVTSTAVRGLEPGYDYAYTVTALNATGSGTPSSPTSSQEKLAAPAFPPTQVLGRAGAGRATVSWQIPLFEHAGAVQDRYTVRYADTTNPAGSVIHTVPVPRLMVLAMTDSATLKVGDVYTVSVAATNDLGSSTATRAGDRVRPFTVPDAPFGLTATPGDSRAVLTWKAPSGDGFSPILKYELFEVDTTTARAKTIELLPDRTSADVAGLTDGNRYVFAIRAVNAAGPSRASAPSAPIRLAAALRVLDASLPGDIAIGSTKTATSFSISLTRPAAINLALTRGSKIRSGVALPTGGTAVAGRLNLHITQPSQLGVYTWVIRGASTGAVLATKRVNVRQTSQLRLHATRSGAQVTVLGAAQVFHLADGRLDPWVGEPVVIQRYGRNGWITIGRARTDRTGQIRLTFKIGQTVGLRLVDAGTATVIGRQTAPSIV